MYVLVLYICCIKHWVAHVSSCTIHYMFAYSIFGSQNRGPIRAVMCLFPSFILEKNCHIAQHPVVSEDWNLET